MLKRTHPCIQQRSNVSQPGCLRGALPGSVSRWPTDTMNASMLQCSIATSEFRVANATGVSIFHPPHREAP
ncbi:hypothetical protein LN470_11755 [Xanthomonas phaseoli]|nr:hypothetical protein [Xanthomonas phaseoli]